MAYVKKGASAWEQMGIEASLPGLRLAVNHINDLLVRMETAARALNEAGGIAREYNGAARGGRRPGAGRPPKTEEAAEETVRSYRYDAEIKKKAKNSYWAKMTPEQRKAEMRRRALKSRRMGKAMKGLPVKRSGASKGGAVSPKHPSNPQHPGHAAWVKKVAAATRAGRQKRAAQLTNGVAA